MICSRRVAKSTCNLFCDNQFDVMGVVSSRTQSLRTDETNSGHFIFRTTGVRARQQPNATGSRTKELPVACHA